MRVLVTGALGTLGRPLVAELRERGHEVWGCDRLHSGEEQFVRADVSEIRQLAVAFQESEPDFVYHLAAEFGRHNGEMFYEDLWKTATIGTLNVLGLTRQHGARLGFASSSEVYGEMKNVDWLSEDMNGMPANEYALSKLTNEFQVVNFANRYGLDAVRLRFFNAYGPGEQFHPYRSVVALFCHKALKGENLPVFKNYHRTFMYIDDFIPTLANVCEAELNYNVYNIGGNDYRGVEELAEIVNRVVRFMDGWEPGQFVDLIEEDLHNVRNKRPDISRAQQDLGHQPKVTIEEGVPLTVEWMRSAKQGVVLDG